MLRNGTMSYDSRRKDQKNIYWMSDDILGSKHIDNSNLNVPCLFMGYSGRNPQSDSVKSPTSTLDFRTFSSFRECQKCPDERKSWYCSKVGLSIVNSLDDETTKRSREVNGSSDAKSIVFGKQMNANSLNFCRHFHSSKKCNSLPDTPASLPRTGLKPSDLHKSDSSSVLFEIGEARSLDSGRLKTGPLDFGKHRSILTSGRFKTDGTPSEIGLLGENFELDDLSGRKVSLIPTAFRPGTAFTRADEIELSEDYTCVRTHGSNPTITHIFGDCILECCNDKLSDFIKKNEDARDDMAFLEEDRSVDDLASYPSTDFLKLCYSCKKTLDGEDIFMYRGDKAFCSCSCRSHEILIDEEMDKAKNNSGENPDIMPQSITKF